MISITKTLEKYKNRPWHYKLSGKIGPPLPKEKKAEQDCEEKIRLSQKKFAVELKTLRSLDLNSWKTTSLNPEQFCDKVWKEMDVITDIGFAFDRYFKNSEHAKRLLRFWFATYNTIELIDEEGQSSFSTSSDRRSRKDDDA